MQEFHIPLIFVPDEFKLSLQKKKGLDYCVISVPDKCPYCGHELVVEFNYISFQIACIHFNSYHKVWRNRICECGAEIARVTHSTWCPKFSPYKERNL